MDFHSPPKAKPGDRESMEVEEGDESVAKQRKSNKVHLPMTQLVVRVNCVVCFAVLDMPRPIKTGCLGYVCLLLSVCA